MSLLGNLISLGLLLLRASGHCFVHLQSGSTPTVLLMFMLLVNNICGRLKTPGGAFVRAHLDEPQGSAISKRFTPQMHTGTF